MKRLLLFIAAILLINVLHAYAQDYTPAKETVPDISRYEARVQLNEALNKSAGNFYWWIKPPYKMLSPEFEPGDSFVVVKYRFDETDRELRKHVIPFSQLEMPKIEVTKKTGNKVVLYTPGKKDKKHDSEVSYILFSDYETDRQIVNALYILKTKTPGMQVLEDEKEADLFKPVALQYRAQTIKPGLSEAARKFLVQATTATEEKRYIDGIHLLGKAIAADQAYPQAHFNCALLWAQVGIYGAAILEMKKYLMLVPDAADARASQDKIYEWMGKNE